MAKLVWLWMSHPGTNWHSLALISFTQCLGVLHTIFNDTCLKEVEVCSHNAGERCSPAPGRVGSERATRRAVVRQLEVQGADPSYANVNHSVARSWPDKGQVLTWV